MEREIQNNVNSISPRLSILSQIILGQDLPRYFLKIHF
jgi:hypothetical protein